MGPMLLQRTDQGLYCPAGDFHVDPWEPVPRAVVTHAHSDHARWGCERYLASAVGEEVLRARLGPAARIRGAQWGERVAINGVTVSLHPAGHILGSAQVRIEHGGEVAVVSGDYKLEPDATCTPFEPVRCDLFVTESTFGLPIYRWPPQAEVFAQVNAWWRANQAVGRTSIVTAWALGKAQRLLAGLDPEIGPILAHGAVLKFVEPYRRAGVAMPRVEYAGVEQAKAYRGRAMVIAPPGAIESTWLRKFEPAATAFVSGWMQVRGIRRRRALDAGFVLSDHADWDDLLAAVRATEADCVWVTHGYTGPVVRWLREQGLEAKAVATHWEGDDDTEGEEEGAVTA